MQWIIMKKKLTVKNKFEITTTPTGKIFANEGDVIVVPDRSEEYYNILKVNDVVIFSRWMRKAWINTKCN